MARPKFKPNETPIENYENNLVNWSMITMKYATPIGPEQKQYDPYYMYTVVADVGGQYMECAWFVNVDEHKIIQRSGATQGSVMAATYVMEGKRRGLVIVWSQGPQAQRTDEQVETETAAALGRLAAAQAPPGGNDQALAQYNGMMGPPSPVHTPPAPSGMPPQAPAATPQPQAPAPPPPVPGTTHTEPSATPPGPYEPFTPAPKPTPAPTPPPSYNQTQGTEQKVYMPMADTEVAVWQEYWKDLAKLHIWAYHQFAEVTKELDLPKIKPTDQREMVTSITIETWRQVGRGRSPLPGWIVGERPEPPPDLSTKDGTLKAINDLVPGEEENSNYFIKRWLGYVIAPVEALENWKHAANIAKLFGLDAEVLFTEHDSNHLMLLTQAIWMYADARDEDLTRNEALNAVADEYGLPKELMDFEEIIEEDEKEDDEPAF